MEVESLVSFLTCYIVLLCIGLVRISCCGRLSEVRTYYRALRSNGGLFPLEEHLEG
jgi:hypothetical protein